MAQTAATLAARKACAEDPFVGAPDARACVVAATFDLNGYTGARFERAYAHAVTYTTAGGQRALALWRDDMGAPGTPIYRDAVRAVYLVDDGRSVTPYYAAGWSIASERDNALDPRTAPAHVMFLHPFPVSSSADQGHWRHAPARAYHVILSRVPALESWHAQRYGDACADLLPVQ